MIRIAPTALPPIVIGIEGVLREERPAAVSLPPAAPGPAELPGRSHLDVLLAQPTIAEFIAQKLEPRLSSTDILAPARFRAVLEAAVETMRQVAEKKPRAARDLGRAAYMLSREVDLRDLLAVYRSALMQG